MRSLLSTKDLSVPEILTILDDADSLKDCGVRGVPKSDSLKGRTIASLFFEDSTRTRISFETAAKRLSAETISLAVGSSSVNKGESLRDTVETLGAIGVDAWVVRHRSSGVPRRITEWTSSPVVNAGDGWHQHPTQALLDAYTITRTVGAHRGLRGLRIAIVGDIRHSRVARSNIDVLGRLGAEIVLVAPRTLVPVGGFADGAAWTDDLDSVVADVDVLYMLRVQRERFDRTLLPAGDEYRERFALTGDRASRLKRDALLMHPGPMNRGTEMLVDPADVPQSRILEQVTNGVAVRMAVLRSLFQPSNGGPT